MNTSVKLSEQVLNHFFRNGKITAPTTVYLALYTTNPTKNDVGIEAKGGGYKRMPITFGAPTTTGKITVSNTNTVQFPLATEDWGNMSHFGIRSAATGGDLLAFGAFPVPKLIQLDDEAKFAPGSITVEHI